MGSIGAPSLVFGPMALRLSRVGAELPGVRPLGPEALQVALQRGIHSAVGNIGVLSLVFGPMGLRLSRAGAELPGVRPHGPEALQDAPTLGFNTDSIQQLAALTRRHWCSAQGA